MLDKVNKLVPAAGTMMIGGPDAFGGRPPAAPPLRGAIADEIEEDADDDEEEDEDEDPRRWAEAASFLCSICCVS